MTENPKNEHAQALGKLKKGKVEKPSPHKVDTSRSNLEKAREALKIKREQSLKNGQGELGSEHQ